MNKICIVTTLKAPLSETLMFVNYHINIGVDHIFLFFDDPNDEAIGLLDGDKKVTCIKCDDSHWKKFSSKLTLSLEDKLIINANLGLELAKEKCFNWIIQIDSDEIIYSEESVKSILSDIHKDIHVARFGIRESVPEKVIYNNIFEEIALFKVPPSKIKMKIARAFGCESAFFNGEYFRGHLKSKCAVRANADIISMGLHQPIVDEVKGIKLVILNKIKLLHFDCCGFDAWKRKWIPILEGTLVAEKLRKNRTQQLEEFARFYNHDNERLLDLYKKLYLIPKYEKYILSKLGMLTNIKLEKQLFLKPNR